MYLVVTGFFGDPKFGTLHLGLLPCIALTDYSWLIVVINCNNEVCSHSNNNVSREFWKKKVLPRQKISCCGVIYNYVNLRTYSILRERRHGQKSFPRMERKFSEFSEFGESNKSLPHKLGRGTNLKILSLSCVLLVLLYHPGILCKRWQVQILSMIDIFSHWFAEFSENIQGNLTVSKNTSSGPGIICHW